MALLGDVLPVFSRIYATFTLMLELTFIISSEVSHRKIRASLGS